MTLELFAWFTCDGGICKRIAIFGWIAITLATYMIVHGIFVLSRAIRNKKRDDSIKGAALLVFGFLLFWFVVRETWPFLGMITE